MRTCRLQVVNSTSTEIYVMVTHKSQVLNSNQDYYLTDNGTIEKTSLDNDEPNLIAVVDSDAKLLGVYSRVNDIEKGLWKSVYTSNQ